jgi:hypothetical protein
MRWRVNILLAPLPPQCAVLCVVHCRHARCQLCYLLRAFVTPLPRACLKHALFHTCVGLVTLVCKTTRSLLRLSVVRTSRRVCGCAGERGRFLSLCGSA